VKKSATNKICYWVYER